MKWPAHHRISAGLILLVCLSLSISLASIWALNAHTPRQNFLDLSRNDERLAIQAMIRDKGTIATWNYLKKILILPNGVIAPHEDTHSLAHEVGKGFYTEMGPDGLRYCDDTFSNGCFHGFIEALVGARGLAASAVVAKVCDKTADPAADCVHGTGHAFEAFEKYHIDKALKDCDLFFSGKAFDCWEGAFMSNNFARDIDAQTIGTAWDLCENISPRYRVACAGSIPLWLNDHKQSVRSIVRVCASAQSADMRERCLFSLGNVVTRNENGRADLIIRDCSLFGTQQNKDNCFLTAVNLVRARQYVDWQKSVVELCGHVIGDVRKGC